jgi:hypothetical protein
MLSDTIVLVIQERKLNENNEKLRKYEENLKKM